MNSTEYNDENVNMSGLKEFFQEIDEYPTFKFYFPYNLGEYVKVSPMTFEIKKEKIQKIRIMLSKPEQNVEDFKLRARAWIEKNKSENYMDEVSYTEEKIGDFHVEVYVLRYVNRKDLPTKIYKIGYVNGYRITISGWQMDNIEELIDNAFKNIKVENDSSMIELEENKSELVVEEEKTVSENNINENETIEITIEKRVDEALEIASGLYQSEDMVSTLDNLDKICDMIVGTDVVLRNLFKVIALNEFDAQNDITLNRIVENLLTDSSLVQNIKDFCGAFEEDEELKFVKEIEVDSLMENVEKLKLAINDFYSKKDEAIDVPKIIKSEKEEYLVIKDLEFDIDNAQMRISTNEYGSKLFLEVNTISKEVFGETWKPYLYVNNGISISTNKYEELVGSTFLYDYEKDSSETWCMYLFEHEDIVNGKIEIISKEENTLTIKWSGEANIYYNSVYDTNVPFECKFKVKYEVESAQNIIENDIENCNIQEEQLNNYGNESDKLNRKELVEFMNYTIEEERNTSNENKNSWVLEKIDKIFEYIKYKDSISVLGATDNTYLTYRQIATLLKSIEELDNNKIIESYYELVDFVHDNGRTSRPVLLMPEYEILIAQLERIKNKIIEIRK